MFYLYLVPSFTTSQLLNYGNAVLVIFAVSMTEAISPTKSVGRAAVLKATDPIQPGMPSPPAKTTEKISVAELATAL